MYIYVDLAKVNALGLVHTSAWSRDPHIGIRNNYHRSFLLQENDGGFYFAPLGDPSDSLIPSWLPAEAVKKVTILESFKNRLAGVYRLGRATLTAEHSANGWLRVFIEGPDNADVQELRKRFKEGTIYPAISYDGPQVPMPALHVSRWPRLHAFMANLRYLFRPLLDEIKK